MAEFSKFTLMYRGGVADQGLMDLYDASRSYYGFARVIAVLGQYYSTAEIISQAPSSEIELFIGPATEGTFRQTVLAGVTGAIIAAPFTTFVDYTIRSWLPSPDSDMKKIIHLLEEQNSLLKENPAERSKRKEEEKAVKAHVDKHKTEIDVMRSITSSSFRQIFRPVGKSVDSVGILSGPENRPIGVVDEAALNLIEAEIPDSDNSTVQGIVNGFSRSSLTGIIFSDQFRRGFRFQYVGAESLPRRDLFSWSQYYGRKIQIHGRFVRFFDGTIKRFEVTRAEKYEAVEED